MMTCVKRPIGTVDPHLIWALDDHRHSTQLRIWLLIVFRDAQLDGFAELTEGKCSGESALGADLRRKNYVEELTSEERIMLRS